MVGDRAVYGSMAGAVGAFVQLIYGLVGRIIGYSGPDFVDFGKIILFYGRRVGLQGWFMGLLALIVWDIFLGVLFTLLIPETTRRFLWFKGALYGALIWFFVQVVGILFGVPAIIAFIPQTLFFYLMGALIYGIVIASMLHILGYVRQPKDLS